MKNQIEYYIFTIIGILCGILIGVFFSNDTYSYSGASHTLRENGTLVFTQEEIVYHLNDDTLSKRQLECLARLAQDSTKVYIFTDGQFKEE